jgi:hypothetical protein
MKTSVLIVIFTLVFLINSFAQQAPTWKKWSWLIGEFSGEGSGKPGTGGGTFSFTPDLENYVLIRKSHSEYPATESKPAIIHNDFMVVYADYTGSPSKAIYFDNEGHTINYSVTYAENQVILLSEKIQGAPLFRLSYSLLDDNKVSTKFEMAQDSENFFTYIEGKSVRKN